jgi:hypothetical protein
MRKQLLASTAAGILVGGILFNAAPAKADGYPVFDYAMNFAMGVFQKAFDKALSGLTDAVTNIGNIFDKGITGLGTQNANYSKASISAQEQIADATNSVMARNARDIRNAQIRDEHVLNPQACASLDGEQAIAVSAGQSWKVSNGISYVTDKRNQGRPSTPAWAGQGQAVAASNQLHLSRYCSQNEQSAGLCSNWSETKENVDQSSNSLLGNPSYIDQDSVNTANDYARNLIEPVPPGALRGTQLTTLAGQDASARRRGYNAQISLANGILNDIIGSHTKSVILTTAQQQQAQAQGLTSTTTASWFEAQDLEVNRRISDIGWHAALQAMPPKSVLVEIATELAMGNYIAWQNYRMVQQSAAVAAAQLAAMATASLKAAPPLPTPQMAAQ